MLKRILALLGQTVCRTGLTIAVDGVEAGKPGSAMAAADRCPYGSAAGLFPPTKSSS
jgi:type IV secretory pathway protease TraF